MYLIVGLGNPGPRYQLTRHNIGFMVVDALVQHFNLDYKTEHKALVAKTPGNKMIFAKPQTFMNLSGESVQALMAFYKIGLDQILVIHDEVDLPFGQIRMQKNRGHGGHNGIRDIHAKVGTDYARLRVGVGRSTNPQIDTATHVLQNFTEEEFQKMGDFISDAADAVLCYVEDGFTAAQNKVNAASEQKEN